MLPARKNRTFEHLFNLLNRGLLYRSFHSIQLRLPNATIDLRRPTVYFVNHSNWWDALLIYQLNYSILHQEVYGMMSEQGLRQFPFFRRLGVFSVNRQSLRDVKASLDYSIQLLQEAGHSLWIFPQGDVFHQDYRPLTFLPGLGYLIEKCAHVQWVPVTFYFSYGLVRKPDVYIEMGSPLSFEDAAIRSRIDRQTLAQDVLTQQLNHLRQSVILGELQDFHPIWEGLKRTTGRFRHVFRSD